NGIRSPLFFIISSHWHFINPTNPIRINSGISSYSLIIYQHKSS
ncbi:1746_t:CDS:1, partial [Funneliformis mosseae]